MGKDNKNYISRNTRAVVLLLGIVFILGSILTDNYINDSSSMEEGLKTVLSVISKVASAVGISLVVGFLTSIIHKEDENRKKDAERKDLEKIIQDTVISKDFIFGLSQDDKLKIVMDCLSEDKSDSWKYKYILNKIKNLDKIGNYIIRSNIDYITTVSKRRGCIVLKTEMSYRAYPQDGKFAPIQHDFEKSTGKILNMQIIPKKGKTYVVPSEKLKTKQRKRHHNDIVYTNKFEIPAEYNNQESITLKITVEESGFDHWAYLTWMSLYPTENISYKVICQDDLIVKEHMIFDNQNELYYVNETKDAKGNITEYAISCDQWTDPYTGFALVIAEP